MTTETETAAVSHRLDNLRAHIAGCSCGAMYVGEDNADLRAQHRAHKTARAATPAKKAAEARARRAAKATA